MFLTVFLLLALPTLRHLNPQATAPAEVSLPEFEEGLNREAS